MAASLAGRIARCVLKRRQREARADGHTGTWWSRDTAGHGGSAWKVYKETSPGKLDWIADADAQGNFISGKWKSEVGKSITF